MSHPPRSAHPGKLDERRSLMRRTWALAAIGLTSGSGAVLLSCGGGDGTPGTTSDPAAPPEPASAPPAPAPGAGSAPPPSAGGPTLGAHALVFDRLGEAASSLPTPSVSVRANASTLLACVGRGRLADDAPPTDSAGNVYDRLGAAHTYTLWPDSGTALYACMQARGVNGQVIAVPKPSGDDEVTLSVVEVANAGVVRDVQWREVLSGQPLASASVTTTGPALLVAWWWGDAGVDQDKTAVPDSGFTVIDSVLASGALVQCAAAVRQVETAGSYNVTWTSTPLQGAQLWLAAVQQAA